jgi:hypothetical protein
LGGVGDSHIEEEAMTPQLTLSQRQTLKAWIVANAPNLDDQGIANVLNTENSPVFWVWRTQVTKAELTQSVGPDGTTFIWVGNGFIGRSAGEIAAWENIFSAAGTIDPSKTNVRAAFADIFSGAGNAAANRTHLSAVSRRTASVVEKLLAVGIGSAASPAVMGAEGLIAVQEVVDSLRS